MTIVTDILDDGSGPVAFVQYKNGRQETRYQANCPWCGKILAINIKADLYGELYNKLYAIQVPHMDVCEGREATEMVVVISKKEEKN